MAAVTDLKKTVFQEILNLTGRVFIVVKHSDKVVIGTRGFTPEEIKNGIVLVFNSQMSFSWDDWGLSSTLVFGATPQKCFIPVDDIVVVYSPELNAQFVTAPQPFQETAETKAPAGEEKTGPEDSNVVKVDFKKRSSKAFRKPAT